MVSFYFTKKGLVDVWFIDLNSKDEKLVTLYVPRKKGLVDVYSFFDPNSKNEPPQRENWLDSFYLCKKGLVDVWFIDLNSKL